MNDISRIKNNITNYTILEQKCEKMIGDKINENYFTKVNII